MLLLKSIERIPTPSLHCAFTSICQWRGHTYIAYRQAQSHNPNPPGHIIIQRSHDLQTWEVAAELRTGGDDRDPHLIVTEDRIYTVWGAYTPYYDAWAGRLSATCADLWTYGAWSVDGTAWGPAYRLCRPWSWLWTCVEDRQPTPEPGLLTRAMGRTAEPTPAPLWYGASYDIGDGTVDRCHSLTFWRGASPLLWERWAIMIDPTKTSSDWQPSEPALFWKDADTLGCIARTEQETLYGEAVRPFVVWTWEPLGGLGEAGIHAPAVLVLQNVGVLVAGREYAAGKRQGDKPLTCCTTIWRLDPGKPQVTAPLRLPSAGDCSYPGLVWDAERQEVLIVWYSQHDRDTTIVGMPHAADIYLGRLTVEED